MELTRPPLLADHTPPTPTVPGPTREVERRSRDRGDTVPPAAEAPAADPWWLRRSADGTRTRFVLLVIAALSAIALPLMPFALTQDGASSHTLPVPALVLLFAVAGLNVRGLRVRRQRTTLSLSELPLTLGLAFVSPAGLLVARVVGGAVAFLARRQSPIKVLFNCVLSGVETLVVLALVRALAGPAQVLDPRGWLVVPFALAVAAVLGRLVLHLVVQCQEGGARTGIARSDLAGVGLRAAACGVFGLVSAVAAAHDPRVSALLLVAAGLALTAHRRYAVLAESHERTQQLHAFTQATSAARTVDQVVDTVLAQSLTLLRAERSEVLLLPRGAAGGSAETAAAVRRCRAVDGADSRPGHLQDDDPLVAETLAAGEGRVVARATRDPDERRFLELHGLREALLFPLQLDGGAAGLLVVGDRAGGVRPFGKDDLLLARSITTQTALALGAARVVDRLQYDSQHDGLTGLANRTLLTEWLRDAVDDVRGTGRRAAVLLVDLDGFKLVNDTLGHAHGDELLVSAARTLEQHAGPHGRVARLGGDEFAVLLLDEPRDVVAERARAMSAALDRTVVADRLQVRVGGSIGVATASAPCPDASTLLHAADTAMYAAKRSGGGVCSWDPERRVAVEEPVDRDAVRRPARR